MFSCELVDWGDAWSLTEFIRLDEPRNVHSRSQDSHISTLETILAMWFGRALLRMMVLKARSLVLFEILLLLKKGFREERIKR